MGLNILVCGQYSRIPATNQVPYSGTQERVNSSMSHGRRDETESSTTDGQKFALYALDKEKLQLREGIHTVEKRSYPLGLQPSSAWAWSLR